MLSSFVLEETWWRRGRSSVLDLADDETNARASRERRTSPGHSFIVSETRGSINPVVDRLKLNG